jgi:hypothetical protein
MYNRSSRGMSCQKSKFGRRGKGFSEISGSGVDSGFEVLTSIGMGTELSSLGSIVRMRELESK